jgi:hypothetical protein
MKHAILAIAAAAIVTTACTGQDAASSPASVAAAPSAAATARATATATAIASHEPAASGGGEGTELDCPDVVDTETIAGLFDVEATGPSGAAIPPGVGELAPGLNQHVCMWDAPGVGLYADTGGRVGFIFGDFRDATAVRTEFDRIQEESRGESISGVGDAAFYVTDGENYAAVEAVQGGDYVIATAFGIGPVDQEPLAELARTVLAEG